MVDMCLHKICFHNIKNKIQSEGCTGIRQKASFRSILLSEAPGSNLFIIVYASSIEQYVKEHVKGSIKSLILRPPGAERWYMIC